MNAIKKFKNSRKSVQNILKRTLIHSHRVHAGFNSVRCSLNPPDVLFDVATPGISPGISPNWPKAVGNWWILWHIYSPEQVRGHPLDLRTAPRRIVCHVVWVHSLCVRIDQNQSTNSRKTAESQSKSHWAAVKIELPIALLIVSKGWQRVEATRDPDICRGILSKNRVKSSKIGVKIE